MIRKKRNILYLFLAIVFLPGCGSTIYFTVDVLLPPQESFLQNSPEVALIQNIVELSQDSCGMHYLFDEKKAYDEVCRKQMFATAFMMGTRSVIDDSQFFYTKVDTILDPVNEKYQQLGKTELLQLYPDADAVIVIDDINIKDETIFIPSYYGGYAQTKANISVLIRLYNVKEATLIAEKRFKDTFYWASNEMGYIDFLDLEATRADILTYLTYEAGKQFTREYIPFWVTVNRALLTAYNKMLQNSAQVALRGDWERANYFWSAVSKEKRGKWKISAALFNKAVYEEILGNFEDAVNYLRQADRVYKRSIHQKYMEALQERLEQQKELDQL